MKILLVNALYAPYSRGGAERTVQSLAEGLARQGAEVVVACTAESQTPPSVRLNDVKVVSLELANLYWPHDYRVHRSPQRKIWHLIDAYNPVMRASLARVLRQEQPHIVHTNNLHGISVAAWSAARRADRPIVHSLRDYYLSCGRASRFRNGRNCQTTCWDCRPFESVRRRSTRHVAAVAANSQFLLDHHRSRGFFANARTWTVIPPSNFPEPAAPTRPPATELLFGYLGRLEPLKGVDLLLDVFGRRRDSGWRLVVAGDGPEAYAQKLRAQHATLPARARIELAGRLEHQALLDRIDVLVVPSLWEEPFARVLIEAAARAVPTVAARRGGIPEFVDDHVSGLLFEPDRPETLAQAIDWLLANRGDIRRLGDNAQKAAERHSCTAGARAHLQVYQSVLAGRPSVP